VCASRSVCASRAAAPRLTKYIFAMSINIAQRPFTLLVKPASADCNLRCRYCFYLDHGGFYPDEKRHRMSSEVLETMIRSYLRTSQPQYAFGWQGGEPTLMGLEFFQRVIQLQQQHGHQGAAVANGLQTNGTLIDDAMARHFAQYNFLLGISVDGPAALHDHYRLTASDSGSHADVLRGIGRLRQHQVEFNILTLVSQANVHNAADVYHYLTDNEFLYHQYISCVEPDGHGGVLPFSISGEQWGEFLCTLFDLWYSGDTRRVSVRLFDSILALLLDNVRNVCHLGANCCQYFVVEYNGDIFPCDFFVEHRLKLGNISRDSWSSMLQSPQYASFGKDKSVFHPQCSQCKWVNLCVGDCLKHRFCAGGGDSRRLSHLCAGWKMFYEHTMPRFQELARLVMVERQKSLPFAWAPAPTAEINRNSRCTCGSGKRYKKCCGKKK